MQVEQFEPLPVLRLTDKAKRHFISKLAKENKSIVRLWLRESGCTGYMHELSLLDQAEADDLLFVLDEQHQLALAKDAVPLMQGTEIDYAWEGVNQVLKYNNPNVTAACGCGESFTVGS